jgi:PUA domain protein
LRIKARHHLREDAIRKILDNLRVTFGEGVDSVFSGKTWEIAETDEEQDFIMINGEPLLFSVEGEAFPTVRGALKLKPTRKRVVVDMGAVKFVAKGADIMSPGIVEADPEIHIGDLVIITDQMHNKPLAVGRALVNGDQMAGNKGKAIKSIHYVGDRIWNLEL